MNNIVIESTISSGAPIIRGRRLTVFNVVSKLYYEDTLEAALEDYEISLDEARDAVEYCSTLTCQNDQRLIKFCSGCILRTLQDKWEFDKNKYEEIRLDKGADIVSISKDGNQIFLGSIKELEDNDFGKAGWLLAEVSIEKYEQLKS